jgi:hypothetical protein
MQNHQPRNGIGLIILIPMIAFVWALSATPLRAQPGQRDVGRETPGERLRREKNERQLAEMELRSVENLGKTKPAEKSSERLLYQQISEDFRRLQVVNNEMMRATFPAKSANPANTLDSKLILRALAEINSRASNLKSNLRLPKAENEEPTRAGPEILNIEQLKSSLLALDALVMTFIANPTFENPGVVEVEQAAKARRDLEKIIELSRIIKQKAQKLRN